MTGPGALFAPVNAPFEGPFRDERSKEAEVPSETNEIAQPGLASTGAVLPVGPVITALVALPLLHSMSTVKPPRARRPLTDPEDHALGSAGSILMVSSWLCSSISAMAAVTPRLPSI